ncbi:hypothetical protein BGX29_000491 [Mortierella sp. GBA35]|nr:hypothetical protein BGX29_000491 [Mortierella sp. GBA35]
MAYPMSASTNFKPPRTRVFELPELLAPIESYLGPPDLFRCIQVCRLWNQLFIPVLWETVDERLYSWYKVLRRRYGYPAILTKGVRNNKETSDNWIKTIYTRHGQHIRQLSLEWPYAITGASPSGTCINLKALTASDLTGRNALIANTSLQSINQPYPLDHHLITPLLKDFLSEEDRQGTYYCLPSWILVQMFWLLILQNPSLESLEFGTRFRPDHFPMPPSIVFRTLATLSNFTRLVNNMTSLNLQSLLEHLPALQHYSCPLYMVRDKNPTIDNADLSTTFPQLRTLHLYTDMEANSSQQRPMRHTTVLSFLLYLPNLERLSIGPIAKYTLPVTTTSASTQSIVGTTPPPPPPPLPSNLQELHVTYTDHVETSSMNDPLACHILPRIPRLKSLSLRTLTWKIGAALAKFCPQLESLKLVTTKYDRRDGDTITPLLHHCPRLKTLDAIWHTVEVDSLMKRPIVCRGLEVLRCQFRGLDRLTDEEEKEVCESRLLSPLEGSQEEEEDVENDQKEELENDHEEEEEEEIVQEVQEVQAYQENQKYDEEYDWDEEEEEELSAAEKYERCKEQHRHIYKELSRLTNLRVLELGVDNIDGYDLMGSDPGTYLVDGRLYYNYFGPTPNTLKLSLDSGLGRLNTLKKLEVFGFEGVDHRIGERELTWMSENWVGLRTMCGLQEAEKEDLFPLNCPKVKELRIHMQKLRPLVKHERL